MYWILGAIEMVCFVRTGTTGINVSQFAAVLNRRDNAHLNQPLGTQTVNLDSRTRRYCVRLKPLCPRLVHRRLFGHVSYVQRLGKNNNTIIIEATKVRPH